jgi:regulator of RNase E activity RraA
MIPSVYQEESQMRTAAERQTVRERFLEVDTTVIADLLDERGLLDQGLSPEFRAVSGDKIAGWAYTITGETVPYSGGGDPQKMRACEGVGPGDISVWTGQGHGVCYFGELIALGMMERGCVGSLVDGGVRDTRWLREHGFATFARYVTPVQSIGRWRVTTWQQPVYLHGATTQWVTVAPGDFILGDDDGAIVVPDAHVDDILTAAEALTAQEAKIRQALRDGMSLSECLERFGHV